MKFVLKDFKIDLDITRLANIHYFEFTPNYHTHDDSHGFCELVYIDKGNIEVASDHYVGGLYQNQMILHGANQRHSIICNERTAPNIIIIGFECASQSLDSLTYAPLLLTDELQKMLAEIIKEARAVYLPPYNVPNQKNMKKRKSFAFGSDQLIKNYLQIFLIKCLRLKATQTVGATAQKTGAGLQKSSASVQKSGAHSKHKLSLRNKTQIYEIREYLNENFRQRITIEELCFLFNTNKTSLSVGFQQEFGQTIVDYLNTLRIDYTKSMLREGNYTLTQIADSMNMSSVHYLTTLFKRIARMSPTEYLRTLRETLL